MGINLNLTWGPIMFVFGLIMFLVGRRQKWQDDPINPRPWERERPATSLMRIKHPSSFIGPCNNRMVKPPLAPVRDPTKHQRCNWGE